MKKIGIRKKLLAYVASIVFVLVVVNILFFFLHLFVINKYEQISANIFNQYKLISATSDLVASYNVYRNSPSEANSITYNQNKKLIEDIVLNLEKTIVNQESKTIFLGVKNTIASVLKETDSGVVGIQEGSAEYAASHFVEANKKSYFVRENTANLILSEVKYSAELEARVERIDNLSFIFGGLFLFVIVIGVVIASNIWASQLVLPLTKLSDLAGVIAKGNMESDVDPELTKLKDEVGSLAQVFDSMLKKLKSNIAELNTSNENLKKSQKTIEENNVYLEKMNKMMIDRELAMVKLKKKIKILTDAGSVGTELMEKLAKVDSEDISGVKG